MLLKNNSYNLLFTAVAMFSLVSCNNNQEEPFQATGDIYYITQQFEGETKTAVAYYVYGNKNISSAEAISPSGNSINLDDSYDFGYTWLKEPDENDYLDTYPEEGLYRFKVVSEQQVEIEVDDLLEANYLQIPEFDTIKFDSVNSTYEVGWEKVEDAQAYLIKILDENRELIFDSYTINPEQNVYNLIPGGSGYWIKTAKNDESYIFQITAFVFEEGANNSDYVYNIQEIAIGESEIVWGE